MSKSTVIHTLAYTRGFGFQTCPIVFYFVRHIVSYYCVKIKMISKRFQGINDEVQTSIMIYDPLSVESETIILELCVKTTFFITVAL